MSVHLVKAGQKRIVVASDLGGVGKSEFWDNCEKLFQIGERTLCGMVGKLACGFGTLIADRIRELSSSDSQWDSPQDFLLALKDDLTPHFIRLLKIPGWHWDLEASFIFGAFAVRLGHDGVVDLYELLFPIAESCNMPILGEPQIIPHVPGVVPKPFIFNLSVDGSPEIRKDRLLQIDPDERDLLIIAGVDRTMLQLRERSKLMRTSTTALTDIAVIDLASGVRWLRKVPVGAGPSDQLGWAWRFYWELFTRLPMSLRKCLERCRLELWRIWLGARWLGKITSAAAAGIGRYICTVANSLWLL